MRLPLLCAILLLKAYNNHGKEEKTVMVAKSRDNTLAQEFAISFKDFNLMMEFASPCPGNAKLIILAMSRWNNFKRREDVRRTWMKDAVSGEVIRFLIADPSQNEGIGVQQKLKAEQKQHGDLLFLRGLIDTYKQMHLKLYGGFKWQQWFCADAEWVMKVEDNAAIHLRRMAYWTDKKFRQNVTDHPLSFIGFPGLPNVVRDPNSDWFVSLEMYPKETYPPFVRGGAYLTTSATVRAIMAHTAEIVGFYIDDVVYTGILAELANATVLGQKMHFLHSDYGSLREHICVDGVPTLFAIFGAIHREDIEGDYESLKNLPCKN